MYNYRFNKIAQSINKSGTTGSLERIKIGENSEEELTYMIKKMDRELAQKGGS